MQIRSVDTLSVSMISNEGFAGYLLGLASELSKVRDSITDFNVIFKF